MFVKAVQTLSNLSFGPLFTTYWVVSVVLHPFVLVGRLVLFIARGVRDLFQTLLRWFFWTVMNVLAVTQTSRERLLKLTARVNFLWRRLTGRLLDEELEEADRMRRKDGRWAVPMLLDLFGVALFILRRVWDCLVELLRCTWNGLYVVAIFAVLVFVYFFIGQTLL